MALGRDTSTFRIDRHVREEIIRNCSAPDRLRTIFDMAAGLAYRRVSLEEFEATCRRMGCILFTPLDGQCNIEVRVTREIDPVMIKIHRVVWAITHTISEQGPSLKPHEMVLHLCSSNGHPGTGEGSCLNPAHFIRGTIENKQDLAIARRLMRKNGIDPREIFNGKDAAL